MFKLLKSSVFHHGFNLRRPPVCSYLLIRRSFNSGKPPKQENTGGSKYKEAFEDLKSKINNQEVKGDDKLNSGDTFNQIKNNIYRNIKYGEEPIDSAKKVEAEVSQKTREEATKASQDSANQSSDSKSSAQNETQQNQQTLNSNQQQDSNIDEASQNASQTTQNTDPKTQKPKVSIKEKISEKAPILGKVVDFVADSWEQTFPSEKYQLKAELARKKAKEAAEKESQKKEYTEEELSEIQGSIPEWKRTAMAEYHENLEEDMTLREKIKGKLKEKINQTEVARKLYQTEEYKEYEEFKKEMSQFKEDLKDQMSQSQNPAVMASMAIYSKATSESSTAMAIREMRKYIKNFDVFDLERDARGIFCDVYNAYLEGDLTYIEKTCMDAALAYFKTLLKKREVENVYPKHRDLWESEPAEFVGGRISERNIPCFTYSIRIQEIHCNISKKTNQIVDGADDRLLQNRYNFVLCLNENPDVETVGHNWAIIEVIPVEAVPLLA